jgi:hypothetical protein
MAHNKGALQMPIAELAELIAADLEEISHG